jgi:predicted nucleic acid-binding protein
MAFIVDASMVAPWLLPDEATNQSDALLDRAIAERPRAPDLLAHEIRSIVVRAVRRNRVTQNDAAGLLRRFEQLSIINAGAADTLEAARLAFKHGLSAYDAAYLWLAVSEGSELATLDTNLRKAALAEGINLLPPESALK